MFTFDKNMEYKEIPFYSAKIPQEMNGYKVAFVTDAHAISEEDLTGIVQELNEQKVDLLILGGDFTSSTRVLNQSMQILSKVRARDGIYGVEGNHDSSEQLFAAMELYGIKPLFNNGVKIREHFYLAGIEDYWGLNPNIGQATSGATPGDFVLLISHNPDVTMVQDTTGVDLVLSGHTHGGHITLFGRWAPALTLNDSISDYGQKFMAGWAESRDGVPVYVSRGIGPFEHVPRVFARPEVTLLTLYHE
jgi:predicted MPP superfamily phosphohydrolase